MKRRLIIIKLIVIVVVISLALLLLTSNKKNSISNVDNNLGDSMFFFNSNTVSYNNGNSGMSSNVVQNAIDELYAGVIGDCYVGYTKGTSTSTQYTCNKNSTAASTTTDFSGSNVKYDNSNGLTSEDVQTAIDELAALVPYCISTHHKENETSNSYDCVINIIPCNSPTNVSISTAGVVTWTNSSNCSSAQHQISIDNSTWTNASSGVDYKSTIISTTGTRTVYVRAVAPNADYSTSESGSKSTTVYSVTLTKGTGIASVTGAGKYIKGATVTINATLSDHYIWSNWTGTPATTTQNYSATINENWSATANAIDLCEAPVDNPTCGNYGSCSGTCKSPNGTKSRTCTHKYYSNVAGYTTHLCSTGSNYTDSTSCKASCTCDLNKYIYTGGCNDSECKRACSGSTYNTGYCNTWQYCACCKQK